MELLRLKNRLNDHADRLTKKMIVKDYFHLEERCLLKEKILLNYDFVILNRSIKFIKSF